MAEPDHKFGASDPRASPKLQNIQCEGRGQITPGKRELATVASEKLLPGSHGPRQFCSEAEPLLKLCAKPQPRLWLLSCCSPNTPRVPSQGVLQRPPSQPKSCFTSEEREAQKTAVTWPGSLHAIALLHAWKIWFFYGGCLRTSPDVSIKAQRHTSLCFPGRLLSNMDVCIDTGRKSQDHRKAN